jgi:hypothetical protein
MNAICLLLLFGPSVVARLSDCRIVVGSLQSGFV